MPHRAPSPAVSENAFDISEALFEGHRLSDDDLVKPAKRRKTQHVGDDVALDIGELLDKDGEDQGTDSDASFIAAAQASSNRKASNLKGNTVKKGGGFQAMGLNATLLKAITRKGFSVPTPIQRKTIPLVMDGRDVVGMARTGSGKTAAFVIPMIQRLKSHSAKVGARAAIMSPSRELALQTLKVVKELGRGTDLRTVLLVGGDSLEDQFSSMTSTNPDIIIATPGRFVHLQVEMRLDLSSVQYVVFDEADRLFEMGFAAQLTEILYALPPSRQTLLFSATLPNTLVEFARAGLQEPSLVRLDAESKIPPDLQSTFFSVKSAEKEGALLYILQDVIRIPTGETDTAKQRRLQESKASDKKQSKKRHHAGPAPNNSPSELSTIVFTATKHHVEYVASMLRALDYSISYVYGSLDQTARKQQVEDFRAGLTHILVVTDVAARGIDIPVLANVINYDFPSQPKIYVHRVGRTARAGRQGWSYSLVKDADVPYLIDLQLFLSRKLVLGRTDSRPSFSDDIVLGGLPRNGLDTCVENASRLLDENEELQTLKDVAGKGEKLYNRTRNSAALESVKRSKTLLQGADIYELNSLFRGKEAEDDEKERDREAMLARVSGFRPTETVFEIGKRGSTELAATVMRTRREKINAQQSRKQAHGPGPAHRPTLDAILERDVQPGPLDTLADPASDDLLEASANDEDDAELIVTVTQSHAGQSNGHSAEDSGKNSEFFMSYHPSNNVLHEDKAYGVASGSNEKSNTSFVTAARNASMNLAQDESTSFAEPSRLRWDKRSKKYVNRANDEDGSRGKKMIKGESGQKIAASMRSGRFDAWRKAHKVSRLPRVGDNESTGRMVGTGEGRRFKHKADRAPKQADRWRDDYHKQKKKVAEAKEKQLGKFDGSSAKSELRSVDDVRKQRQLKEKRKEKNARPSRKRKQ